MYQPPYRFIIPATPTKSRVETQIQIKLRLTPLPPGIKRIHFPKRTISKPKNFSKPPFEPSADTLELHTSLVCTSAMQNPDFRQKALARALKAAVYRNANGTLAEEISPPDDALKGQDGGEVLICQGCRTREQKRAGRKKKNTKSGSEEASWQSLEMHRVVVFNCNEVEIWKEPKFNDPNPENHLFSIDAPMRLACYCRHHSEKLGFQVIFTITDFKGNFIAQNLSHSIMITDDHKATQVYSPPSRSPQGTDFELSGTATSPVDNMMVAASPSDYGTVKLSTPTPRGLSRPASPSSISGPSSKKRKSSNSGISGKIPGGLTMTRLPPFPPPAVSQQFNQAMDNAVSSGTSHYPATPGSFNSTPEQAISAFHPVTHNNFGPPPTPSYDQPLFPDASRTPSLDQLSMAMFPVSTSQQQSRAPTPNGLRPKSNPTAAQANNQLAQMMRNSIYAEAPASSGLPVQEPPTIYKIIPSEGPKAGGIEVTVLGSGFHQGMEVMFGDKQAATTTFWGESSLVCLLPPSPAAGPVLVTLKSTPNNGSPRFFQYRDDDEQQLIRTALSVLGGKLSGNILDVAHLARRIIDTQRGDWRNSMAPEDQGGSSYNPRDGKYENQLLKVLELIDLDDSPHKPRLNLRRATGQTMLHLACSLGMQRFVAGLLARGANPDLRDKGGYTPLHMASLNNHPEIVQRLIACRADPTLRTLSGLTPADVAGSAAVVDALRRARSRSVGSLHSRASSDTSIKSLWGPLSRIETAADEASSKDVGTEEESPEYSSEYGSLDVEDSDSDSVEDPWLDMRRGSIHESPLTDSGTPAADAAGGIGYPAAAVTAFKEQFAAQIQQIQQSMALHLQNLPQFPYLPQMPNMPPLPEYQAAMFQRLASMVPTIGGPRPGSAGEHPAPKELDSKWWALPSLIAGSTAPPTVPPPAYEEIYPRGSDHAADADKKQASAAQAAAEAEADLKCAALYDSQQTSEILTEKNGEGSLSHQQTLPAMLQIGRKNAITKEQQQNLRRAHAERVKRLSRDRNLFCIWIPLLVIIICAMLYNRLPGLITTVQKIVPSGLGNGLRQAQEQGALAGFVEAVQAQGRVVEEL
ncbi:hypothetical protein B0T22DRAFT_383805 [Podospora appendiculata]|uniref:IPT/TIG domain-containing protein n=1 Tax=Podospora appendiculata TaxID=314037 RepID=A0AAE0X2N9_9PEZI|nr:hypothetical protein B0T22DRAFT_383805 [Podospora appendiculata]